MHRVESILEAIKTTLTGLASTGDNIERDRVYPVETLPFISVEQGKDEREPNPSTIANVESNLDVKIVVYVKSESFTTELNQVRAEVYAAMMASNRLGLGYVESLRWIDDSEPELSGDAEIKNAVCTMSFKIGYTHSLTTKES